MAMTEKMTLAKYLDARGKVRVLTRIEAEAFGVPYPLVGGWVGRHGATVITEGMLARIRAKTGNSTTPRACRARNGLEAGMAAIGVAPAARAAPRLSKFPGFALRVAQDKAAGATGLPWKV
jgi:hypothetical protein